MALLAQCPACKADVMLPEEAGAADHQSIWVQCPECDHAFTANDAAHHLVKQAAIIVRPPQTTDEEDHSDSSDDGIAAAEAPKFSSSTLSAFLGQTHSTATPTSDSPAMAEFESLDDLVHRGRDGLQKPKSPDEAPALPGGATDDNVGSDLRESQANHEASSDSVDEPSPEADRMRAPLAASDPADEVAESGGYDAVNEEADVSAITDEAADKLAPTPSFDDFLNPSTFRSTLQERGDLRDTEVAAAGEGPSFDFHDSQASEGAKSLRESMGFGTEQALEVEPPSDVPSFDNLQSSENADVVPELHVGGDAPRGTVATRRRSGTWSIVRTLFGVASGGVVGIVAGYLILLWIVHFLGRTDEPLDLAKYYPDVVKPATFQDTSARAAPVGDAPSANEPSDLMLAGSDAPIGLERIEDAQVEPANVELPVVGEDPVVDEPPAAPPVVIAGAPSYTAAQLLEQTGTARQVAGDLISPGPIDKSKGSSYAQLAALAEALTYGEGANDVSWKNDARRLYPPLFDREESRRDISTIAEFWLASPKRGHGGIFFCGALDAGRQQGSVAEYTCTLSTDGGQKLTVLVPRALPVETAEAASVAVVGAVVDAPALAIEGYTGNAERAIWAGEVFAIGE